MDGGKVEASRMASRTASLEPKELARLFLPAWDAGASRGALLAVSGGSDSVALMLLFARWLQQQGANFDAFPVATVDHGLRAASAAEADFVVAAAKDLGFAAVTLRWTGPKPASGRAEAAREARYRLLADLMRERGVGFLFTAHTADDQAETLLMRLARGSGVDGLAGMAPLGRLPVVLAQGPAPVLARPLLTLGKADLQRLLRKQEMAWIEDPTNLDTSYERPRLREVQSVLDNLGLTSHALGKSARRLRRAREALETIAAGFYAGEGARGQVHALGHVELDLAALLAEPEEIAVRVLRLGIIAAGGAEEPVALAAVEGIFADIGPARRNAWTLAKAALRWAGRGRLLIEREPGRLPLPEIPLEAGMSLVWDGRFVVEVGAVGPDVRLAALSAAGLARVAAEGRRPEAVPARTLRAVPALWRQGELLAVPGLDFAAKTPLQPEVRIRFKGLPRDGAQP